MNNRTRIQTPNCSLSTRPQTPIWRVRLTKRTLLTVVLLLGPFYLCEFAGAAQFDWASTTSPGWANAAGAPDAVDVNGASGTSTFGGFGSGVNSIYSDSSLATVLGVTPAQLAQANFIAFDGNGTANVTMESGTWTFSDGLNSFQVVHVFNHTAAQDGAGVVALGNINLVSYKTFFGTPTIPAQGDFAYILFDVGGNVNLNSSTFGVTLQSPGDIGSIPGTPDIDAVGRLAVPEPSAIALSAFGLVMFALCSRYLRKLHLGIRTSAPSINS